MNENENKMEETAIETTDTEKHAGRPRTEHHRDYIFRMRMTQEERKKLKWLSEKKKMSKAGVIREVIEELYYTEKDREGTEP